MAEASYAQSSFLGGQFSPAAQGRFDLPEYLTALAASVNGLPVEEGSWTERSGTWTQGRTANNANGKIATFWLPENQAGVIELTATVLRVWIPKTLVSAGAHGYEVLSTFTGMPWLTDGQAQKVRIVQADATAFLLIPGQTPFVLICTNYDDVAPGSPPAFALETTPHFEQADGPYLDALVGQSQTNNSLGTVDGNSFTPVFTITDGAYSFVATDANRAIRLWSQPPAWNAATHYSLAAFVTYAGQYWRNLVGDTPSFGIPPGSMTQPSGTSTTPATQAWSLVPTAALWVWGYISSVSGPTAVNVTLISPMSVPTLQNGLVIDTWQLGLYTDKTWPTSGTYQEGRLVLGGAVPNRFDTCISNGVDAPKAPGVFAPTFSPTDSGGNVLDSSGISYTVNSVGANKFLWMEPDHQGVIAGTAGGEWVIAASALNDPLTPTSVQAHKQTAYKSQNIEPVRVGQAIIFVQSFGRRVIEYTIDAFSQRFIGRHLNEYAKDLTTSGVSNLTYQEELAPVIWAVTNDGRLIGCTYRRVSHFGQEKPVFYGWHQHLLGSGRKVHWVTPGSDANGTEDVLMLLTEDANGVCRLEMMLPLFDAGDPLWKYWPFDGAISGSELSADVASAAGTGPSSIVISGVLDLLNATVGVWLGGLDCGEYVVDGNTITIPLECDPDGLLTVNYLAAQAGSGYGAQAVHIPNVGNVPLVVGSPFEAYLTTLRPQTTDQVRTQTGPGFAKRRRLAEYALQFSNTITGATVSVDGGVEADIQVREKDDLTFLDHVTLYDGVYRDEVDDDYTLDGQITISMKRPYPMTVNAISGFLKTTET